MRNRWSDHEAAQFIERYRALPETLALRTYTSQLIGCEGALVLHGGGNTSAKGIYKNRLGHDIDVLWIKGSGWDLATIEPQGHPAVKMRDLDALRTLEKLGDEDMVSVLRAALVEPDAPTPSIEALVHAFIPHRFIDHTHADAVLSLVNQPDAEKICRAIYGKRFAVIPWIMPGFELSKAARKALEENPEAEGLLLLQHGIFTFADSAKESYTRMIAAISEAEAYIERSPVQPVEIDLNLSWAVKPEKVLPRLRGLLTDLSDPKHPRPPILHVRSSETILRFIHHPQVSAWSQVGPATPDHVIRTKPLPLLLQTPSRFAALDSWQDSAKEQVEAYIAQYQRYFEDECKAYAAQKTMLDPFPRVVLVPELGIVAAAQNEPAAMVAADIYEHSIQIISDAFKVGAYQPLNLHQLFEMEYWSLEQAKLKKQVEKAFSRQVVLVTGAGSGIGFAIAQRFAREGAHLVLVDIEEERVLLAAAKLKTPALAMVADITKPEDLRKVVQNAVLRFGGLDLLVSNAGKAYSGKLVDSRAQLRESFEINFFAHAELACAAIEIMETQGYGGCLLFNASKSATAPGPDFGPYAIPKAATLALMRQLALDYASSGIRSNAVNADRVRTQLFGEGLLQERLKARGLSEDQYFKGNLLRQEVLAEDVAEAFYHLALSSKTTGAVLPVDGGNIGAAPR